MKLCRAAASDSGGTMWVYSPPVGKGAGGRMIPVERGSERDGLVQANIHLNSIEKIINGN